MEGVLVNEAVKRIESMIKLYSVAALLVVTASAFFCATVQNNGARVPVLLELFTSEGCSSCPPADRLLEALDRTQPVAGAEVIVLSEHVDYWNRLGWRDPFSSAQYSGRQSEYASKFHLDSVYTPQLVVDGRVQFVGSDGHQALSTIESQQREQKIALTISNVGRTANQVTARIELPATQPQNNERSAVLFVALADNKAASQVARGENAGRALAHVAVVRVLTQVGTIRLESLFTKEVTLSVQPGVGTNGLRVVAFLQDPGSGNILGAALQKLQ
jgi:hypothetical protein